jgi:hypothetical protein
MGWGPFGAPGWGYDMVSPPAWVRPTSPPVAPSGQRAADVRARVLMLRALGHWKTSSVHASKPRDARYLDRGTTQWYFRAPARQGPFPEEGTRGTLKD